MAFGYDTVTGWNAPTFSLLFADWQAKYQAETTANTDVENGPAADMGRTIAGMFKDAYDSQEGAYISGFITAAPGTDGVAEGSALEVNLADKIGPKLAAAESTVVLPLFADVGPDVNIPAGSRVRISGETEDWIIVAPVLIPGGGQIDATFEFSSTGPKNVVAPTTWTIQTPVTGWLSAGPNAAPAIPGRDEETDAEYRQRYRESLLDNLVKEVRGVDGVTSARTIEWPYGVPDAFWGLTHWVELIVVGGDDTEIAEAIHRARAKGVKSIGTTTILVADADYIGGQWPEAFSRPTPIRVYVEVDVVKGQGYPGDDSADAKGARSTLMQEAVKAHFDKLNAGDNTSGFKIASDVDQAAEPTIPGIADLVVRADLVTPPFNTGVLSAGDREILTVAILDITINGA